MASFAYCRAFLVSFAVYTILTLYLVDNVSSQQFTTFRGSKWYVLGNLTKCARVPNEPPCNITRAYFVSDYASRQYTKLMEKIYRMSRDIARLDSRVQCVAAYERFLCAQYFPECKKGQDPRYPNLRINRRVIHSPKIQEMCSNVISSCNSAVGARFIGERFYLCDFLNYPPEGWELNRCVKYNEENRCQPQKAMVPAWLRDQHDQEVQQFMNLTTFRINHTLPEWCRYRIDNFLCRHPICSDDGTALLTNYTRQRCSKELECARFIPGELNVDAVCLTFPSRSAYIFINILLLIFSFVFSICLI